MLGCLRSADARSAARCAQVVCGGVASPGRPGRVRV